MNKNSTTLNDNNILQMKKSNFSFKNTNYNWNKKNNNIIKLIGNNISNKNISNKIFILLK